jgi:hypothetical protein
MPTKVSHLWLATVGVLEPESQPVQQNYFWLVTVLAGRAPPKDPPSGPSDAARLIRRPFLPVNQLVEPLRYS